MIQFIIIKKILLSLVPLFAFYFLRKMGKKGQPKRKSHLWDVDKSQIIDGEIVKDINKNPT